MNQIRNQISFYQILQLLKNRALPVENLMPAIDIEAVEAVEEK
jgi:hypothetical protein